MNKKYNSVKINSLLNTIKQIFSIILPMITFPYATRLLGAENYGKYTFSSHMVNYLTYLAAAGILRYATRECSRVRDDKDKLLKTINELYTINIITTLISYVLFALLFLIIPTLKEYSLIISILSISVIFTTLGTDWINGALEDYFYITVRYIICQFIATVFMFILVRDSNSLPQYAFVTILGGVLANILNIIYIRSVYNIYPKVVITKSIIKHVRPMFYMFVCSIATFIYINSDVSVLRIFSNDLHVGYYGVSTKYYQIIKEIISAAFVVVIPRISNELTKNHKDIYKSLNNVLIVLILLIVPSSVGLYMIRNNVIVLFSGVEYLQSSTSLAILSIAIIPALLSNYFINIVMIPMKMDRKVMIATAISALVNLILNIVFIPTYHENAAAFTTLIAEIVLLIIALWYCKKIKHNNLFKPTIVSIIGSALIVIICMEINHFISNITLNTVVSIVLSIIIYGSFVMLFSKEQIIEIFKKDRRLK